MRYRNRKDFFISEIGVGTYSLSGAYGLKDPGQFKALLAAAVALGINFFDTAEAYGDAERIVGEALKPYRKQVRISTKVGIRKGYQSNLTRAAIQAACEGSLKRLQVERIDLYSAHFDDPNTPVEETVAALESLKRSGKIRAYGVGHLSRPRVEKYLQFGDPLSIMMELSPVATEARRNLLPLCQASGAGAIAFSVTGRGLLSGRFEGAAFPPDDIRSLDPLFQRERLQSGLKVAAALAEIGHRCGRTPAQIAIAWTLAQPDVLCALCGPSTLAHLEEDARASDWDFPPPELSAFESFLSQEETRLRQLQRTTIGAILAGNLPAEPGLAIADLAYVFETSIQLALAAEEQIIPLFRELLAARQAGPGTATRLTLETIQKRAGELLL